MIHAMSTLPELAVTLRSGASMIQSPSALPELVVTLRIGRQHYALPLESVSQVVRLPDLTDIAGAPPVLAGVLNLRGTFLPVLDGHVLINIPSTHSLDSSILVIAFDGAPILGLLVDEVEEVQHISVAQIVNLSNGAAFIRGILRDGDRSIILIDPVALRLVIA